MYWEGKPLGQDSQDAHGACSTVCIFIARVLCALPRHVEVPDINIISNQVIIACMQWRNLIKKWSSIKSSICDNFLLGMAIVGEDAHLNNALGASFDVNDELARPSFLDGNGMFRGKKFNQPVCAMICDGTYTYLVCKRFLSNQGLEYFFFDPHGNRSLIKGFESSSECAEFIGVNYNIHKDTELVVDWTWVLCTFLPPDTFSELEEAHKASYKDK